MKALSREQLKVIYKKVKHLRIPPWLEKVDFEKFTYISWIDQSDKRMFLLYEYKDSLAGLRLDCIRPPQTALRLGFCEFCKKHRKSGEVCFVATQTKRRPKGVEYQTRGTWICQDYNTCNAALKTTIEINDFFFRILEKE
jgi:hypothetical protein